ncbi:MAG: hypothetical protein ACOYB2_10810 [Limnohabitans sp.]
MKRPKYPKGVVFLIAWTGLNVIAALAYGRMAYRDGHREGMSLRFDKLLSRGPSGFSGIVEDGLRIGLGRVSGQWQDEVRRWEASEIG